MMPAPPVVPCTVRATEPATRHLIDRLRSESGELLPLAQRVVAETPGMGPDAYTTDELAQLVNGFEALVLEALEDKGTDVFDFFVETAIPGLVADGQSSATLVQAAATFGVLFAIWLSESLTDETREAGQVWLAGFVGRYVREVAASAVDAEAAAR